MKAARTLAEFGIGPLGSPPAACGPPIAAFYDAALGLLPELANVVRDEVVGSLEQYSGTWHPTGFMVFPLGAHPRLGSLRFHVWPAGLRRREPKGRGRLGEIFDGDIHDHAWGVASIVLTSYRDAFYDVVGVEQEVGPLDADRFRLFTVAYGARARNALTTDGSCVNATIVERRSVSQGEFHTIDPGRFHAPTIRDEELGATLVFSSPRIQASGPHVLIGGGTEPIVGHRVAIAAEDAAEARSQLTQSW